MPRFGKISTQPIVVITPQAALATLVAPYLELNLYYSFTKTS